MSYAETSNFPWYIRSFLTNRRSAKVFAGSPLHYGALDRKSSPIESALRTLITVLVSQLNRCAFCMDINTGKRGPTKAHLEALREFDLSSLFDGRISAALAHAAAITKNVVNTKLMARLRNHFNDDAIIELAAQIAFQSLSGKFNSTLAGAAPVFCTIPPLSKNQG